VGSPADAWDRAALAKDRNSRVVRLREILRWDGSPEPSDAALVAFDFMQEHGARVVRAHDGALLLATPPAVWPPDADGTRVAALLARCDDLVLRCGVLAWTRPVSAELAADPTATRFVHLLRAEAGRG
jgi:hypothetical protein